jgi:hypothetical protein
MSEETLSLSMFWVGVLFAFTPILVVAIVIATTWHIRKKQRKQGELPTPR